PIHLPHSIEPIEYHYNNDEKFSTILWYRKTLPFNLFSATKRNVIEFEGVATRSSVYLNGNLACIHDGGFTPFTIDIPQELLNEKKDIVLVVKADASETLPIAPYGGVIDYVVPVGIYREVFLYITEKEYIENCFTYSRKGTSFDKRELLTEVTLHIDEKKREEYEIEQLILDQEKRVIHSSTFILHASLCKEHYEVEGIELWSIKTPTLYTIGTILKKRGKEIDREEHSFGFRDVEFRSDGFFLNGELVKLRGLNRHQQYPYVGFAMPKRGQQSDADFLKYTLGVQIVRTAHYPQSRHFLDRCDEIGLLVFTEIPGWQHISKEEQWRRGVLSQLKEMIIRDRNHPSVILWGVRINESADDDELYGRTNEASHFLDPSRQTGGVRNIASSHLLEDVYTYNDFSIPHLEKADKITKRKGSPYLVSEHTGHMYPVRRSEGAEKNTHLALHHYHKLNSLYKEHSISGAIGWCMSDYLTHQEFGSPDNICYHGVSDQFRILKQAGYVYASMSEEAPVLSLSGDFSIGSYPAHARRNIYAYTNCDSISLYYNGEFVKEYFPDRKTFSHLPHPPIIIDDVIGKRLEKETSFTHSEQKIIKSILLSLTKNQMNLSLMNKIKMFYLMKKKHMEYKDALSFVEKYLFNWTKGENEWRIVGIKDNKEVKEITLGPIKETHLTIEADTSTLLIEDTYDLTRVVVKEIDQYNNVCDLSNKAIEIETDPQLTLIGPRVVSLIGGIASFYVKTNGREGTGEIKVKCERESVHTSIEVKR
ncbi:MAG: glycoside hydrolase family 2 protein, partial [Spirochaetia bacterium]|nr:glycoside hydrolase family 2 protein [Spirochaetia bacterium]